MLTIKEFLQQKLDIQPKKVHKELNHKLWHAMTLDRAIQVVESGVMIPYTSHRFWKDGILRHDKHPEYESSNWMHGWSFTRTKQYAVGWGQIVFEFDKEKVLEDFKIKPICWGATIKRPPKIGDIKRETEEFILSGGIKESTEYYKGIVKKFDEEYDQLVDQENRTPEQEQRLKEICDYNWMDEWRKPVGKEMDIKSKCTGIYISERHLDILQEYKPERLKKIMEHPLYKGLLKKNPKNILENVGIFVKNKNDKTIEKLNKNKKPLEIKKKNLRIPKI